VAQDDTKVYALNLCDVADREEYLAYSRRSAREVARHGGRVVALGAMEHQNRVIWRSRHARYSHQMTSA